MEVDTAALVVEAAEDTRMGTTAAPAVILADTQILETIQHPTPMGMIALGLEHESSGFLHPAVSDAATALSFLFPYFTYSLNNDLHNTVMETATVTGQVTSTAIPTAPQMATGPHRTAMVEGHMEATLAARVTRWLI